jgi:hypothetical protein
MLRSRSLLLVALVLGPTVAFFSCSSDDTTSTTTATTSTTLTSGGTPTGTATGVGAGGTGAGGAEPDAGPCCDGGTHPTCGNGRLDSREPCDGPLFDDVLTSCDDNWLGSGEVACTERCTLDFSGCELTDYCQGLGFYDEGQCDACELMGGHADPDCAATCGPDGTCSSWFDPAVGYWSCPAAGFGDDPDCGTCGNGTVEGRELCDGTQFTELDGQLLDTCEVWSYSGGTLGCNPDCTPDFSTCVP